MGINRNQIYLIGIGIILFVIFMNKISFLLRCNHAEGEVIEKVSHYTYTVNYGGKSIYPIVEFTVENHKITFIGGENLKCKIGDTVDVIYLKSDFTTAKIFSFNGFWLPGLIYGLIPFIFLSAAVFSFIDSKDIFYIKFDKFITIQKYKK